MTMSALEGAIIGHYIGKYIVNAIVGIFQIRISCIFKSVFHHFEVLLFVAFLG
jgi:hypothetical protein